MSNINNINESFFDVSQAELFALAAIEEIGSRTWLKIASSGLTLSAILKFNETELIKLGLTSKQAVAIKTPSNGLKRVEKAKECGINIVLITDKEYPQKLLEIYDPPLWLFYQGDISITNLGHSLTVIGTRTPTTYASEVIELLLTKGICEQTVIVSGLAYGVDTLAHMATTKRKSKSIAVLAGGLDSIYPKENFGLAEELIKNGGLLLTEYPPLTKPLQHHFPIRNRILAGLSQATLVIEAALPSGSLITAKCAIEHNRDVLVVPGNINSLQSAGCNNLIESGAIPIINPQTLAAYLGIASKEVDN